MDRILLSYWALGLLGGVLLVVGIGFVLHVPWITVLWPETSRYAGELTDVFVGSIFVAIGSSVAYGLWRGERSAAMPGLLALAVLFGTMAITLLEVTFAPGNYLAFILPLVPLTFLMIAMLVASIRTPRIENEPAPIVARFIFVGFAVVLVIASGLLMARVPNAFPWPLPPLTSALYGCLFFGVAFNYATCAWRGRLIDAKMSMVGFFLYDVILIGPLLGRFASAPPEQMPSLYFYVFVLVFSAAVTIWLFLRDRFPVRGRAGAAA